MKIHMSTPSRINTMKYEVNLSNLLNQDIYLERNNVYLSYGTNKHLIGTKASTIKELRSNMAIFIGA